MDFSLNYPAWCLLAEGESKWGSFHRTTKKIVPMMTKEASPFKVFSEIPNFSLKIIEKERADGEYWEVERKKIENFLVIADSFIEMIKPHIDDQTVVFMEGKIRSCVKWRNVTKRIPLAVFTERVCPVNHPIQVFSNICTYTKLVAPNPSEI